MLDRIDLHVEVPAAEYKELSSRVPGTSSKSIREGVIKVRRMQLERFRGLTILYNSQMTSKQLRGFCTLTSDCVELLKQSVNEMGLSARAHDKVLRVSRIIADLECAKEIRFEHLSEAINYRQLDRQIWS